MSHENVELIRAGFAAFERGDLSQMLDLMADDLIISRADPDGATFHGKEGFREVAADWTEGFSEWAEVPKEFMDAGDFAVTHVQEIAGVEAAASRSRASSDLSSRYTMRRSRS
jgi:ketosteroid isomerase-like protein